MPIQSGPPAADNLPQCPSLQPMQTSGSRDLDAKVWRLYVRGHEPRRIGKALGQSADWGELTIRRLLDLHENSYQPMIRAHAQKLLDELNHIRRSSWNGWRRSQKDKVRTVEKTKEAGSQSRSGNETVVTTEPQCGDASFLRMLTECNKRESALRGIEKPTAIRSESIQSHADLDTLIQRARRVMTRQMELLQPASQSGHTDTIEPNHNPSPETQD